MNSSSLKSMASVPTTSSGQKSSALQGLDGNDTLKGRKADDLLNGGASDDKLRGRGGADVYVGSAGEDKIMGFSFEEGDVIAIDESIGFEVFQPSNPERSLKIIHDAGTILVKGITAEQAIDLQNAIQITA